MRLSWRIGQVSGIDLYLHPSALLWFFLAQGIRPTTLETIAFVFALLGSIVLHELGHALMARRYGIPTADITLYLIGGVARLERMPRSAGPELLIALAGPAVNFVIVAGLLLVQALSAQAGVATPELLEVILSLNVWLGVFNLLPVFPMDGGRVLRAMLSGLLGRLRATEVAAILGRVIVIGASVFFLLNGMVEQLILAVFIGLAGTMELRQVRGENRSTLVPRGLTDAPVPPAGFRWAESGDGVWRLVPILMHSGRRDRPWA